MWPFNLFSRMNLERKAKHIRKRITQDELEQQRLRTIQAIEDRVAESNKQFKLKGKN